MSPSSDKGFPKSKGPGISPLNWDSQRQLIVSFYLPPQCLAPRSVKMILKKKVPMKYVRMTRGLRAWPGAARHPPHNLVSCLDWCSYFSIDSSLESIQSFGPTVISG